MNYFGPFWSTCTISCSNQPQWRLKELIDMQQGLQRGPEPGRGMKNRDNETRGQKKRKMKWKRRRQMVTNYEEDEAKQSFCKNTLKQLLVIREINLNKTKSINNLLYKTVVLSEWLKLCFIKWKSHHTAEREENRERNQVGQRKIMRKSLITLHTISSVSTVKNRWISLSGGYWIQRNHHWNDIWDEQWCHHSPDPRFDSKVTVWFSI